MLTLLNASGHSVPDHQRADLSERFENAPVEVLDFALGTLDPVAPFADQMLAKFEELVSGAPLFEGKRVVVLLPGHAVAAGILIAAWSGRFGFLPTIIRLADRGQGRFEVAELIDLNLFRNGPARRLRSEG